MFAGLASVACQLRERTSRTIRFAAAGEPLTKPKKGREVADTGRGSGRPAHPVESRHGVAMNQVDPVGAVLADQTGPLVGALPATDDQNA